LAAIEVSTLPGSVALLDLISGEEVGFISLPSELDSASALIPALEELLKQQALTASDLSVVAVSVGPGSFTGIRVGISTALGLGLPSQLYAFGISTLDGLVENFCHAGLEGEVLCLIDAQRNECFVGHYQVEKDAFYSLGPPAIWPIQQLNTLFKDRVWLVGPGAVKYEKELRINLGSRGILAFTQLHRPSASSIARLAYQRWKSGERPSLETLQPIYLRIPAADENA
jgi:tRNA threonylcarbamoyladenosine biosynthesis protein TsaB